MPMKFLDSHVFFFREISDMVGTAGQRTIERHPRRRRKPRSEKMVDFDDYGRRKNQAAMLPFEKLEHPTVPAVAPIEVSEEDAGIEQYSHYSLPNPVSSRISSTRSEVSV